MTSKKRKKELTTAALNIAAGDARNFNININEVLTKRNRYLVKQARGLKREGKVKFAW